MSYLRTFFFLLLLLKAGFLCVFVLRLDRLLPVRLLLLAALAKETRAEKETAPPQQAFGQEKIRFERNIHRNRRQRISPALQVVPTSKCVLFRFQSGRRIFSEQRPDRHHQVQEDEGLREWAQPRQLLSEGRCSRSVTDCTFTDYQLTDAFY